MHKVQIYISCVLEKGCECGDYFSHLTHTPVYYICIETPLSFAFWPYIFTFHHLPLNTSFQSYSTSYFPQNKMRAARGELWPWRRELGQGFRWRRIQAWQLQGKLFPLSSFARRVFLRQVSSSSLFFLYIRFLFLIFLSEDPIIMLSLWVICSYMLNWGEMVDLGLEFMLG